MHWMLLPFRRTFDFTGRSRRREYWLFALLTVIVSGVLAAIAFGTGNTLERLALADPDDPLAMYPIMFGGVGILMPIWWLIILIPTIAVTVRRLHDRNLSGWWYLGFVLLSLLPVVGFLASIAFIVVMALPGTPGPNRYGPSPKQQVTAETFA